MRLSLMPVALIVAGCHGAAPQPKAPVRRTVAWDSATAYRVCEAPDSVIAGRKECVLLDQGRRADRKFAPPPAPR
jgi:hypothetical protein